VGHERETLTGGVLKPSDARRWKAATVGLAVGCAALLAAVIGLAAQVNELRDAMPASEWGSEAVAPHATVERSQFYVMHISAVAGKHDGALQISQLEFFDLNNQPLAYTPASDQAPCTEHQTVDILADDNLETKFCVLGDLMTVKLVFEDEVVVGGYRWGSADDNQARDPTGFSLFAKREGQWQEVSTLNNYIYNRGQPLKREHYSRVFRVGAIMPKTHYALHIHGAAIAETKVLQFSEMEFKDADGNKLENFVVSVPEGTKKCENEGKVMDDQWVDKVNDGDIETKFCTQQQQVQVNFLFDKPVVVASYRMAAADDNIGRDPAFFDLMQYDVNNFDGSHHSVSEVIDYVYKRGAVMERGEWSQWWTTHA